MDSDFEEIPFRVSSWGTLRDIPFLASLLSSNRIFLGGGLLREFLGYTVLDPKKTDIDLFFQDAETYHATKEWFEREPSVEKIYQCPEE